MLPLTRLSPAMRRPGDDAAPRFSPAPGQPRTPSASSQCAPTLQRRGTTTTATTHRKRTARRTTTAASITPSARRLMQARRLCVQSMLGWGHFAVVWLPWDTAHSVRANLLSQILLLSHSFVSRIRNDMQEYRSGCSGFPAHQMFVLSP